MTINKLIKKYEAELKELEKGWNGTVVKDGVLPTLRRIISDLRSLAMPKLSDSHPGLEKQITPEPKYTRGDIRSIDKKFMFEMAEKWPQIDIDFELEVYKNAYPNRKNQVKCHKSAFRNHLLLGFKNKWCQIKQSEKKLVY